MVAGLLGRVLHDPTHSQPVGEDIEQWMRVFALTSDGIPFGWTPYRPSDLSGKRPAWYDFAYNGGDIDTAPVMIPMGPRHFSVLARTA